MEILSSAAGEARNARNRSWSSSAATVFSYLALIAGLGSLAATVYLVERSYSCLPFGDKWSIITFWARPTQPTLHWLWAQHNEHRILLSKIVLLLDYRLFHGLDLFAMCCNFLTQLTLLAVLLWAFATMGRMGGAIWRTVAGISAVCLFSTAQWENFVNGFQVAFFFVGLFFTLAIVALLRCGAKGDAPGGQWKYAAAAALAGAAATYSLANGIIVWPILILVAILARCRKSIIAFEAISGLLVSGSYLYHYKSPVPRISPWQWLHQPYQVAAYVVKYVGAPVNFGHQRLAAVCGVLAVSAALLVWCVILFSSHREALLLLLAAMMLFVLGSAAITALGRLHLGTNQALSSRYNTVALLLWLALAVLLVRFIGRRSTPALVAIQAGLLLIICLGAARLKYPTRNAEGRELQANTASLALLTGVFEQQALAAIFPNPALIWQDTPYLKARRLSIFATALARHLDQPFSAVYGLRSQPCWGEVATVQPIAQTMGPGLRLSGWAWDPLRREPVKEIVFVAGGKIVGYATLGVWRPDLSPRLGSRRARRAGWTGYVGAVLPDTTVTAYAALQGADGGQACALAHPPASPGGSTGGPISFSAPVLAE